MLRCVSEHVSAASEAQCCCCAESVHLQIIKQDNRRSDTVEYLLLLYVAVAICGNEGGQGAASLHMQRQVVYHIFSMLKSRAAVKPPSRVLDAARMAATANKKVTVANVRAIVSILPLMLLRCVSGSAAGGTCMLLLRACLSRGQPCGLHRVNQTQSCQQRDPRINRVLMVSPCA